MKTTDPIIDIDALATGVDAHNWTWAESQYWCSGSGSYSGRRIHNGVSGSSEGHLHSERLSCLPANFGKHGIKPQDFIAINRLPDQYGSSAIRHGGAKPGRVARRVEIQCSLSTLVHVPADIPSPRRQPSHFRGD